MAIHYAINGWAACAPGLASPEEWRAWAQAPSVPQGTISSTPTHVPPLLRRRLAPLGRAAVQAAQDCRSNAGAVPVVMASRYGDAERALRLLAGFAVGEGMSPTDFTLSVHNAIGAIHAIAHGDTSSCTSIAAGATSAASGLMEAAGLLADGAPEVLLVCYDAPLPAPYADFADEPDCTYAWAWRLAAADPARPHFSLSWQPGDGLDDPAPEPLAFGLQAHQFVLSSAPCLARHCAGMRWMWRRHAGVA